LSGGSLRKYTMEEKLILSVNNLKKYFPVTTGFLRQKKVADVKAVDGVSFTLSKGETLGLVGESGCGKTTLGRCVLQLYRPTSGEVFYQDQDLCKLSESQLRPVRRKIQVIFQDPYDSLNPRFTASDIVSEPLKIQGIKEGKNLQKRISDVLETVGLAPYMAERYPHEFSGGQRQRLGIARALILQPDFIVCDEPISALDVSIQAQIINLLDDLQKKFGVAYLFISHDLSIVRHISDRVAIMYLGKIMELAPCDIFYESPMHPYTQALLSAVPLPDPTLEKSRSVLLLKGEVPSPLNPPAGCVFHPRCPRAFQDCRTIIPQLNDTGNSHMVACLLYKQSYPQEGSIRTNSL
jgi:oligopeptide/dipeptide ABC transporter ATP-binding protein